MSITLARTPNCPSRPVATTRVKGSVLDCDRVSAGVSIVAGSLYASRPNRRASPRQPHAAGGRCLAIYQNLPFDALKAGERMTIPVFDRLA